MYKLFLVVGSVYGALGVALGAFGAHALKTKLTETNRLDTFETAVKYQFYHAIGLLIIGLFLQKNSSNLLNWAGYSFVIGTLIFSGSLYILCFTNVTRWGAVTPFGGLLLIVGWILAAIGFAKSSTSLLDRL